MPTYDYGCECGHSITDYFRHINDPDPACTCGKVMRQTFLTPRMVNGAFLGSYRNQGYLCPVTNQWVDTKRARNNIMAEHNLVERPEPIPKKPEPPTISCAEIAKHF